MGLFPTVKLPRRTAGKKKYGGGVDRSGFLWHNDKQESFRFAFPSSPDEEKSIERGVTVRELPALGMARSDEEWRGLCREQLRIFGG